MCVDINKFIGSLPQLQNRHDDIETPEQIFLNCNCLESSQWCQLLKQKSFVAVVKKIIQSHKDVLYNTYLHS